MLAIENNIENHPILKQIYDKLAEFHIQGKQLALCVTDVSAAMFQF